jgi:hypothetical protein
VEILTCLQHGSGNAPLNIDSSELASGRINILHGIRRSELAEQIGKTGNAAIGMVAMVFDYILDDKTIPDAMRALIGRLQIPVLKVALLDQNFFTTKAHPARRLLNRLAGATVGWDSELGNEDLLYAKVEAIVQTILDEFVDDTNLFAAMLEEFDSFLRNDEEQAALRAQRSAKVMEGEERLEVAKTSTTAEIDTRLNNNHPLGFVRDFLATHWKNLLYITCARQGKDSEAWKQAVATMDELIWSVQPKNTPEERQRLVSLQPRLLQKLRAGMERLSIPATERDDFIARLVHAQGRTALNSESAPGRNTATVANRAAGTRQQKTPPAPTTLRPASRPDQRAAASQPPAGLEDQFTAMAGSIKTGDWLEFRGSDGKAKRAKLSWISPVTGTYLFTDRQGLKAGHYSKDELARLFRAARARALSSAPLMDRAVSTVLEEFRPG